MAFNTPLTVTVDYAQPRVLTDRLSVSVQGSYEGARRARVSGWDMAAADKTYVDPITYTAMLLPAPCDAAWASSGSGIYARPRLTNWTLSSASNWDEACIAHTLDFWLRGYGLSNDTGVTTSAVVKNRPLWVSAYVYAPGDSNTPFLSVGWNDTASAATGVSVQFYVSGVALVSKDGVLIDKVKLSGPQGTASLANGFFWAMLIPFRKRELLIVTSEGGGGTVVFDDIDESSTDPTITAAGKVWFQAFAESALLQIAPLKFQSSGYVCGRESFFPSAPPAGATAGTPGIWWHEAYDGSTQTATVSMVETADPTTAFAPDGVKSSCLVRFDLTGNGDSTPFVYGGIAGYSPTSANTSSSAVDVTSRVRRAHLSVPESASGVELNVEMADVSAIEAAGVARLFETSNRPVGLMQGAQWILDGYSEPISVAGAANPEVQPVSLKVRDAWKALEAYRFSDIVPLDGTDWKADVEWIVGLAVPGVIFDVDDPTFTIPSTGGQTAGEWASCIEIGDSAATAVANLFSDYAPNWLYQFVETVTGLTFMARSPANLSVTPSVVLYSTWAEAYQSLIAGGATEADAYDWAYASVINAIEERRLEPEANDIRVTGVDPRTNLPIQVHYADAASQDPTTAPASRPDNWLGCRRLYGYVSSALTSVAACERACNMLVARLTQTREMAEVSTNVMLVRPDGAPVWRGDCVTLYGRGDYRVTSFQTSFELNPSGSGRFKWVHSPSRYVLEKIPTTATWRAFSGAFSLAVLTEFMGMFGAQLKVRSGSDGLRERLPGYVKDLVV